MKAWQRWGMWCIGVGVLCLTWGGQAQGQSLEQRVEELEKSMQPFQQDNTFRAFWKNGLRLQTVDEEIEIRIGGRLHIDWNFFFPNDDIEDVFGDPEDRFFVRRARLFIRGTLYKIVKFKSEFDFAGGEVDFKDNYIQLVKLPIVGAFAVGLLKDPFGLEEMTSSRFITFQERSLTDAFVPGRNIGFLFENALLDERITWAIAVTREVDNDSTLDVEDSGNDYNATVRFTGLPWYDDKGRKLAHVGFAYSYRQSAEDEIRYRTRPEARLDSLRFVDTGALSAKDEHRFGFESAVVYGRFSLQGEFMLALPQTDVSGVDDPTFHAFYVMGSVFLTGEHRPYSRSGAKFKRPKPRRNFDMQGGLGAWEVALRVSHIDLSDAFDFDESKGGKELNVTVGVNWYLNPNTRVTWNYVLADVDRFIRDTDDAGNVTTADLDHEMASIFMMRFQVDY